MCFVKPNATHNAICTICSWPQTSGPWPDARTVDGPINRVNKKTLKTPNVVFKIHSEHNIYSRGHFKLGIWYTYHFTDFLFTFSNTVHRASSVLRNQRHTCKTFRFFSPHSNLCRSPGFAFEKKNFVYRCVIF